MCPPAHHTAGVELAPNQSFTLPELAELPPASICPFAKAGRLAVIGKDCVRWILHACLNSEAILLQAHIFATLVPNLLYKCTRSGPTSSRMSTMMCYHNPMWGYIRTLMWVHAGFKTSVFHTHTLQGQGHSLPARTASTASARV